MFELSLYVFLVAFVVCAYALARVGFGGTLDEPIAVRDERFALRSIVSLILSFIWLLIVLIYKGLTYLKTII